MPSQTLDPQIQARLTKFKADLRKRSACSLVRRYITFGDCYVLDDDRYFALREDVADHFGVHPNEVFIVGSGKLGFSIAPKKRYRPFGDTSDIDVAVISPALFDGIWEDVFTYKSTTGFWEQEKDFQKYLFRGWIRPDLLPPAASFRRSEAWTTFFREMSSGGKYGLVKIAAGIYRTGFFFERYQMISVRACQDEMVSA